MINQAHNQEQLNLQLKVACKNNDIKAIHKLLANGANVNIQDDNGVTALHDAALYGHTAAVKLLLERGSYCKWANSLCWPYGFI